MCPNTVQSHVVQFDSASKIRLIRMSWDQGALLKQVDVIGSRAKNWPICDGIDQIRLITSNTVKTTAAPVPVMSPRGRDMNGAGSPERSASPSKKHIKDPHVSLDLFEPQKEYRRESQAQSAPRASARPPQREMSELFAAGHEDYEPSQQNGGSPKKSSKDSVIAPKGAGSQKFMPSRLFEEDTSSKSPAAYKSNPAKYNHFDLGEEVGNDPLQHKAEKPASSSGQVPMRPKTNKHMSQWDFQDFATPQKVTPKDQGQHARNFSWSAEQNSEGAATPGKHAVVSKPRPDADTHFAFQDDGPDVRKQPAVSKPRPDAETHFDLRDNGTPAVNRKAGSGRGAEGNKAQGLYDNHLYDDGSTINQNGQQSPLKSITNNAVRKNDFGAHWNMWDSPPANDKMNNENKPIGDNKAKAIKSMGSHWDTYDESPEPTKKPARPVRQQMQSSWGFGDD